MSYTLEVMHMIAADRHGAVAQVRHVIAHTGRYVSFVHGVVREMIHTDEGPLMVWRVDVETAPTVDPLEQVKGRSNVWLRVSVMHRRGLEATR